MPDTPQPRQGQSPQPGIEARMEPRPDSAMRNWKPSGKLAGKVALVTGGDSGIGRAAAIGFAKEGADVAILYLDESGDAADTKRLIEAEGRRAVAPACIFLASSLDGSCISGQEIHPNGGTVVNG